MRITNIYIEDELVYIEIDEDGTLAIDEQDLIAFVCEDQE